MFYDANELADFLRLKKTAFYRAKAAGDLPPAIRIGGRTLWRRSTVFEWLEERECPVEINPVLSERAQKAVRARKAKSLEAMSKGKKRGRPTKEETVKGRIR